MSQDDFTFHRYGDLVGNGMGTLNRISALEDTSFRRKVSVGSVAARICPRIRNPLCYGDQGLL
jgi:hypothetical protein